MISPFSSKINIEIIDYICSYFMKRCVEENHPWIYTWRASMISNGALYFDPRVQNFLKKFRGFVSFGITIDGPKEIHNACRIYHDGHGNFDDSKTSCRSSQNAMVLDLLLLHNQGYFLKSRFR